MLLLPSSSAGKQDLYKGIGKVRGQGLPAPPGLLPGHKEEWLKPTTHAHKYSSETHNGHKKDSFSLVCLLCVYLFSLFSIISKLGDSDGIL